MLKQTRAEAVEKIWNVFTSKYAEPKNLLESGTTALEKEIHVLGLSNQRAVELFNMASYLQDRHDGVVPDDTQSLLKVPGIGLYSAHAILSFAFRQRAAIVDTNILRLYSRNFGIQYSSQDVRRNRWAWEIADALLPVEINDVAYHNYGLLDFTGMVCVSRNPHHDECPIAFSCIYSSTIS